MQKTKTSKQKTISEYYMLGPKIELIWTEELSKNIPLEGIETKLLLKYLGILIIITFTIQQNFQT